jgi:hypothetical protein
VREIRDGTVDESEIDIGTTITLARTTANVMPGDE